jgi:hypothetical protein
LDTTTEIGLSAESLLNRFDGKVGISAISDLPESNLRVASQVNILRAISDELHQSTSHVVHSLKKKIWKKTQNAYLIII